MVLAALENPCMLEKASFGSMCGVPEPSSIAFDAPMPASCGAPVQETKNLYKLVKVGTDGSLEPASAEEAARVESIFHGADETGFGEVCEGDLGELDHKSQKDAEQERQGLLERMELLNRMLARVADEEIQYEAHMGLDEDNKVILGRGCDEDYDGGKMGTDEDGGSFGEDDSEGLWDGGMDDDDAWGLDSHLLGDDMAWDMEREMGGGLGGFEGSAGRASSEEMVDDSCTLSDLRASYYSIYGRSTTSNNRQWLLKRLSGSTGGNGAGLLDMDGDGLRRGGGGHRPTSGGRATGPGTPMPAGVPGSSPRAQGKRQARPNPRYFDDGADDDGRISPDMSDTPVKISGMRSPHMGSRAGMSARAAAARMKARGMLTGGMMKHSFGKHDSFKRKGGDMHSLHRKKSKVLTPKTPMGKGHKGDIDMSMLSSPETSDDESDDDMDRPQKRTATGAPVRLAATKRDSHESSRRRKHHNPWTLEESKALIEGVSRCGGGKWADIKKLGFAAIENRTAVDLKDKWRNLLRIAMLPSPASKAVDKKREIPPQLLLKVRELATRSNKKPPPHDGRSNRGRPRHGHVGIHSD